MQLVRFRPCAVFVAAALVVASALGCARRAPPAAPPTASAVSDAAPPPSGAPGEQRFAELGTCALESGETITGCRIGYRTFGKLDAARSNVVLFSTWFTGTTEQLAEVVPDKLVDTNRFFLVLVDALGDGVSSSPSNSRTQPRLRFPHFTIRDMVESQRRLLREVLGVERLHAVMGISMGGMQAFEWTVTHPDEVARAVPIVGTPQLTSHDLLLWNAELHALENDVAYAGGQYQGRPKIRAVQDIHWLMLTTPAHRAEETSRGAFPAWLEERERDVAFDWNDRRRQLEAMLVHDIAHGGSLDDAARKVRARTLVAVAAHDHMVAPGPSLAFARAAGAPALVMEGPCGHLAPNCEAQLLGERVRAFLAE